MMVWVITLRVRYNREWCTSWTTSNDYDSSKRMFETFQKMIRKHESVTLTEREA